jgi:capsid protein
MIKGGETVVRKNLVADKKLAVPVRFQPLVGDFLDHRKNERIEQGRVHQGVAFDANGRRTGYYLYREHPGQAPCKPLAPMKTQEARSHIERSFLSR